MLTPQMIQQANQATGNNVPLDGSPVTPPVQSRADQIRALGRSATASVKTSETSSTEPSLIQKAAGAIINPIETSAARAGQAVGGLALKGINALTGGMLDKYTPEGNLQDALSRALNTQQKLPITGGNLAPVSQETPETVAGHALGTAALGAGGPILGGAALGASSSMENKGSAGEVALTSAASAVAGKILEVGFHAATPYIVDVLAKFGTPAIEALQRQLPDYAKPALDKIITAGKEYLSKEANIKFEAQTNLVPEGGKLDITKARDAAWQDIQPKTTSSVKTAYGAEGAVSKQGLFSKAEITPTNADSRVIDTLQPLYENGRISPTMPIKNKMEVIDQEAARLHADQKEFLYQHDIAVPLEKSSVEAGLFPTLANKSERSKLIFSKDPAAAGAYDSAIAVFKRCLVTGKGASTTKGATTLTKIDDALTAFDKEMEQFGAWDRLKTGQLTETDKARIAAIRDIHTITRDYIADHLPKNSPWKSIRLNESNMYEAAGRMAPNLGDTVGESQWSQFWKDHPTLKQGALWTIGLTGAGAAGATGAMMNQ